MKKLSVTILTLLSIQISIFAQTKVKGHVKDNKGHVLAGASISIKDSYDGGITDSTGNFSFKTYEKGDKVIIVKSMGYKNVEQPISLKSETLEIPTFILKEEINELSAVTVTAGSFAAGDKKRGTVMSSLDIATTAGANADITAALKTLPGTQQIGEQEGLFVRGGAGYETKQYIDGTLVNNPYYSSVPDISSRGRFQPFLFKGTVFSTGGYSAQYGQALSSVLLLESIDLPEKSEVDATLSPLIVGVGTQQLAKNKKYSYGVNYSYTNVGLYFSLVKQTPDYFKMPQFHNADANFRFKTKRGMVKYYTTFSKSDLGLRRQDIDSLYLKDAFQLNNTNWYNNLSWRESLGKGWRMDLGSSYSTNKDNIVQQIQDANNQPKQFNSSVYWMQTKNYSLVNTQNMAQAKAVFEKRIVGISTIRFGSEFWHSTNNTKYNDTAHNLTDNYTAAFAESDIYVTNDLAAKVGLRFENSSVINKADIAPRVSLAYKTGKDAQISAAYGIFYQRPEYQQLYYNTNVGFTKATHYILNYQKMTTSQIFRVEAYYKKYDDLIKTVPVSYNNYYYNNAGSGYAQGVELFWRDKKTFKNVDYWFSYSYVDTKRDYMNYTEKLQPNFAATHTASLVTKRFFTDIKTGVSFTYSFATGRPYYNFMIDNGGKYYVADQGKTKDYNSLGFSAYYVPSVGKTNAKTNIVVFASVTNVLGANNIYGYNYSYSGQYKQAIEPPAQRFYFIGVFLSWGVDRSEDAINGNL